MNCTIFNSNRSVIDYNYKYKKTVKGQECLELYFFKVPNRVYSAFCIYRL